MKYPVIIIEDDWELIKALRSADKEVLPAREEFNDNFHDGNVNLFDLHYLCVESDEGLSLWIFIDGIITYLGDVLYYLLKQQGKLSQSALLEQLKCKDKIKALHKPLHIIPRSLRPSESIAY